MKKQKRGWGDATTLNFSMLCRAPVLPPTRSRVVLAPDIRRAMFKVFHFDIIYREVDGLVQVLAVAHHRRQPGYWVSRL